MLADEDLFGASLATPLSSPTGAGAFTLVGRGVGTDVTEGDGVGTGSQSKLSWNVSAPFGPIFSSQPLASTSAPRWTSFSTFKVLRATCPRAAWSSTVVRSDTGVVKVFEDQTASPAALTFISAEQLYESCSAGMDIVLLVIDLYPDPLLYDAIFEYVPSVNLDLLVALG